MSTNLYPYQQFKTISRYYRIEELCPDTKEWCFGGRAPNRHRLFLGMVHVHIYLKGEDPIDPSLIYLSRNDWIKNIVKLDELYPELKLFHNFCRSGKFGSLNELVHYGMVFKEDDPNDGRGGLFAINPDHIKCAGCVIHK